LVKEEMDGCEFWNCVTKGCTVEKITLGPGTQMGDNLVTTNSIEINTCSGECASQSVWKDELLGYGRNCACCSIVETAKVMVNMTNTSTGVVEDVEVDQPVLCSCAASMCSNEEL
jgi:hypothetical protein